MVLTPKKPHIGNTIIHPENGLHYAYYGTVLSQERADALAAKFTRERHWVYVHKFEQGFSVFHRHATLEHPRQPFGKVPPKEMMTYEQAIARSGQGKDKKNRQAEPGARDSIAPKVPRVKLDEQEKRARKIERRAARRLKKKEERANQKVQSVLGQIRPDFVGR